MPYYRCPSCRLTSYSAAPSATACATCSGPLSPDSQLHVATCSAPDLRRTFRARPEAAAEARRAVSRLPLSAVAREKLTLVVSELVGNSVRHARLPADSPINVLVTTLDGQVRVEVRDSGPGFAVAPADGQRMGDGYGFAIVSRLSEAWGVACDEAGCTVWCAIGVPEAVGLPAEEAVASARGSR